MIGIGSRRHPLDSPRINLHEDWELRYWAGRFSVSHAQLMATVKRVGVQVSDVARALGRPA